MNIHNKMFVSFQIRVSLLVLLVLFMISVFSTTALAQTGLPGMAFDQIDIYVQKEMQSASIPGLSYAIVKGDQVVHMQALGKADDSGRPVTTQTPFFLASLGKIFTALAIQQLVQSGQVALDRPVQTYIPWFHLADEKASQEITIRQLLTHTSGISNGDGNNLDYYRTDRFTNEEIVRSLGQIKLNRPSGSSMEYSNLNYIILGQVIEQVSGLSYEDYVQEHILTPLKMEHTFTSIQEASEMGLTQGHRLLFGFITPIRPTYARGVMSAGYQISTVEDMSHILIANLNQGNYQGVSVLSPDRIPFTADPQEVYYDVHWIPSASIPKYLTDAQSGGSLDFSTCIYLLPTFHTGVVVLANANTAESIAAKNACSIAFDILEMTSGFIYRSSALSSRSIYLVIDILLAAGILLAAFQVFRLRSWEKRLGPQGKRSLKTLFPVFLVNILVPLILLIGVPLLIPTLFSPGLAFFKVWPLFIYTNPDIGISIWVFAGTLFIVGAVKLIWFFNSRRVEYIHFKKSHLGEQNTKGD